MENLIEEFEMSDDTILSTSLPLGLKLSCIADAQEPILIENYRNILRKPLYLSRGVRYVICYAVNLSSRS